MCCAWQGIVAEINLAIGATGIISGECKLIVDQYADLIIQLLMSRVCCTIALIQ